MGFNIRFLDIEIPYWILFICIIVPLLIITPFFIGPNCHGYCTEEQARTMMGFLLFAMIGGLIILAVGISAWQFFRFVFPSKNAKSFPFEKIDGIMGLSFGLGALTISLLFVALISSYGFSLPYLSILILPIAFSITSFFLIRYRYLKVRGKALLSMRGTEITTDFLNVEMDMLYSINSRHPYQITSVGIHPATGAKIRFFSDHIWLNPTGYVPRKIKVIVDPQNQDNYHMDLSFLKENLKDIDWDEMVTEKFRIKE